MKGSVKGKALLNTRVCAHTRLKIHSRGEHSSDRSSGFMTTSLCCLLVWLVFCHKPMRTRQKLALGSPSMGSCSRNCWSRPLLCWAQGQGQPVGDPSPALSVQFAHAAATSASLPLPSHPTPTICRMGGWGVVFSLLPGEHGRESGHTADPQGSFGKGCCWGGASGQGLRTWDHLRAQ